MQNQATATAPAAPPPPQGIAVELPVTQTRPITQAEIGVLRQQRNEMSNQLQSAQNRRERLLNEIRDAPPGTEQGMLQQLQVLNARIVAIENDIEASGRTLRTGQVPASMVIVPPQSFNPETAAERGALIGASVLLPVLFVYMVARFVRRRRRGNVRPSYSADHDARMERLEQAVDAIAIEVERVGESQRYQSKLLAEANMMPAFSAAQRAPEPVRARDYDSKP